MPSVREPERGSATERLFGAAGIACAIASDGWRRMRTLRRSERTVRFLETPFMAQANVDPSAMMRVPLVGFLAWFVPGLGHWYLGQRGRALVFFFTIAATFWTGVAIGSVQGTVAPKSRKLWFVAQVCNGGNALGAVALHRWVAPESFRSEKPVFAGPWLSSELGVHYTGVSGLLNVLVIFDALALAEAAAGGGRRRSILSGAT